MKHIVINTALTAHLYGAEIHRMHQDLPGRCEPNTSRPGGLFHTPSPVSPTGKTCGCHLIRLPLFILSKHQLSSPTTQMCCQRHVMASLAPGHPVSLPRTVCLWPPSAPQPQALSQCCGNMWTVPLHALQLSCVTTASLPDATSQGRNICFQWSQ